jgi:hypothetical protein
VKYLLENSSENSRTLAAHLRYLSIQYGLKDPVEFLKYDPPMIYQFEYLNVSRNGLRGSHHTFKAYIITTQEVKKKKYAFTLKSKLETI